MNQSIHIPERGKPMLYLQDAPLEPEWNRSYTIEMWERVHNEYIEALKVAIEKGTEVAKGDEAPFIEIVFKPKSTVFKPTPGTYPLVGVEVEVVWQKALMIGYGKYEDWPDAVNDSDEDKMHFDYRQIARVKPVKEKQLNEWDKVLNGVKGEETVKEEKCTKGIISEGEPQDRKDEVSLTDFATCCWNAARIRTNGSALDPAVYQNEKHPFKYSWDSAWMEEFLKTHIVIDIEKNTPVLPPDSGESETYPKEFILWYSGMDKVKAEKAFERWKREFKI